MIKTILPSTFCNKCGIPGFLHLRPRIFCYLSYLGKSSPSLILLKARLIFLAFLILPFVSVSQQDSCHLRMSLLTCSPGEELYSAWGHTAIRVTDQATGMDMVYNYGTFDDSDPDFYFQFTKGIMHYALSVYPYSDFLSEYQYQNRGIIEQVLDLSCNDKATIYRALQVNNIGENRFYYYYFHTDNCTTRAKDMIVQNNTNKIVFKNILPHPDVTFRHLIHSYLDYSDKYWSKFGIDLFLGLNLDKKLTNEAAMFLPDYLKKGFDSALVNQKPIVSESQVVLKWPDVSDTSNWWFSPLAVFSLLLILVVALTFYQGTAASRFLAVFDSMFFFLVGLLGLLMITLWLIRVDDVCRNNMNLLWALPTHTIAAFLMHRKDGWIRTYFKVTFWLSLLLAITWFFIPQQINTAVAPLNLLILIRSYFHTKKTN